MLVGIKNNLILSVGLPTPKKTYGGVNTCIASVSPDKPGCLFLMLVI